MMYKLVNSELVCQNCGYTEDIIINTERHHIKIHLEKQVLCLQTYQSFQ